MVAFVQYPQPSSSFPCASAQTSMNWCASVVTCSQASNWHCILPTDAVSPAVQEAALHFAPPAAAAQVVLPEAPQALTPAQASGSSQVPDQERLVQHLRQLPVPGQAQAQAPSQAPSMEVAAGQLPQLPAPLNGAAISQFLASYHTGQTSTAGRPVLAMGPLLNTHASDALPLLGAGFPGLLQAQCLNSPHSNASCYDALVLDLWSAHHIKLRGLITFCHQSF